MMRARLARRALAALGAPLAMLALGQRAEAAGDPAADKPFAEHKLVLQLSDREAARHALVLSVASNVMKAFDPDKVAIAVVAFGPGIDLLRAESPNRALVDSLVVQGVQFDVCMNTVETVERETGRQVALNPHAQPVAAGVARIMTLVEAGYTLVRP
jgi:intracellular sulfur oxidation DsrE/DsrF family protein